MVRKYVWFLGIIVALWASEVRTQGAIGVYADSDGIQCGIVLPPLGPGSAIAFWVAHRRALGVTGASFTARLPSCFDGDWIWDTHLYSNTVGDSQSGVTVNYGSCVTTGKTMAILAFSAWVTGPTPNCCCFRVTPHPNFTAISLTDCEGGELDSIDELSVINPTEDCLCDTGYAPMCVNPVPTKNTTWSRLKAIYSSM